MLVFLLGLLLLLPPVLYTSAGAIAVLKRTATGAQPEALPDLASLPNYANLPWAKTLFEGSARPQ
ncbi:hypothetical protein [Roseovarius pelagicus]|uniref:Uncharacterized protein n=1 Tax=Roseovarius pelagicus TaxID=2980108 RepID=A0ABY6DDQ3_9RHOB|nr:hypothetical protein [Roseovarius pelagicus]UXX83979.1 hypothetical protein N7U68_04810 [Roseovarius pelagicus]